MTGPTRLAAAWTRRVRLAAALRRLIARRRRAAPHARAPLQRPRRPSAPSTTASSTPTSTAAARRHRGVRRRRRARPATCSRPTRVWWRILLDLESPALDADVPARGRRGHRAAPRRGRRASPRSAEAWFYLGGAYGARVQLRVLPAGVPRRGARRQADQGGARTGAGARRRRSTMRTSGIGLYEYYADIAPAAAKFLRMPAAAARAATSAEGLKRMCAGARARARDGAARPTSSCTSSTSGTSSSSRAPSDSLRELERAHPEEPVLPAARSPRCTDVYFHDRTASLDGVARLLERAARGRRSTRRRSPTARARLGAAQQLDALYETDAAIELLQPLGGIERPTAPFGAASSAWLQLGLRAATASASATGRVTAYAAGAAAAPAGDPQGVRARARTQAQRAPAPDGGTGARVPAVARRAGARSSAATIDRRGARARPSRSRCATTTRSTRYRCARVRLARRDERRRPARSRAGDRAPRRPTRPTFHARRVRRRAREILERRGERDARARSVRSRGVDLRRRRGHEAGRRARAAARLRGARRADARGHAPRRRHAIRSANTGAFVELTDATDSCMRRSRRSSRCQDPQRF